MLMQKAYKARIYPTPEQEKHLLLNLEAAKRGYNYARGSMLAEFKSMHPEEEAFKETIKDLPLKEYKEKLKQWRKEKGFDKHKKPKEISKELTQYKKVTKHWIDLKKQGALAQPTACAIAINFKKAQDNFWDNRDAHYSRVKDKLKKNPKAKIVWPESYGFPRKKHSIRSFMLQVRLNRINYESNRIFLSTAIGWVRVNKNQPFPMIKKETKKDDFYVRIIKEGSRYFISFPMFISVEYFNTPKTEILGVDLGLKDLAILSNGMHLENISKTEKYKKIQEKIKKLNKKKSWLVEHSPKSWNVENKGEKWKKADSIQLRNLTKRISKLYFRLNCLKSNYMHKQAEEIVRTNPKGIVFENLNVKGMHRNKKLSKSIQETGMSAFKTILIWHATKHGIPCKEADKYYASTQLCSACGKQHPNMRGFENLNKRVFTCPYCGAIIDRDENAAINLRKIYDEVPLVKSQEDYIELLNMA